MDDLIIRVLKGDASPFEVERLRRWRNEASENDAYVLELARIWELTAPEAAPFPVAPPSVQEILAAAQQQPDRPPLNGHPIEMTRTRRAWRFWGLLAASVAALALGVQLMDGGGPAPLAEYLAPADQTRTVTLEDGSVVRLAQGSLLRVWGGEGTREVSLEGRGFFAVTRDENRPFTVRTEGGEVTVLGTRFEVVETEAGTRTIVVEGRVSVSNDRGSVEVGPGELARISRGNPPAVETPDDIWALLEWSDGILIFQGTPLTQVAREVSRQFGRPLRVMDPGLGGRRITAWFHQESFEEVTESICLVLDASCAPDGPGIRVEPRGGVEEEG